MNDVKCPKCGHEFLHIHSTLVLGESEDSPNDVHYEWECSWCGHREGNYESTSEAIDDYENKHGGDLRWMR